MEAPQRELATTDASKLVLSSLERVLRDTSSTKEQIADALAPVFGIRWDAQIVRKIHSGRMCNILAPLRNSNLDKSNYQRIVTFWKGDQKCEPAFTASWGEWRDLIGKFNLDDAPLSDWTGVIAAVTKLGWASPVKLAQASSDQISAGLPDGPTKFLALQLWRAAALVWADSSAASHLKIYGETEDAADFIARFGRASLSRREVTNDIKMSLNKKSHKKDFLKMGPSAKLHTLREAAMPQFKLNRFPEPLLMISPSPALKSASQASIPASADISAFANCGDPPFPVTGRIMVERSGIFSPGATFSNYVGYIRKACYFLEAPLIWDASAVKNVIEFLKLQWGRKIVFRTSPESIP